MAAPSYTEDLTDLATGDEAAGWVELTGSIGGNAYSAMGIPAYQDPDYPFIQGQYSVTQDCTKNSSVGSLAYNNGAGTGGHGTDGAYFVWQNFMVPSNVGTYAQGGFQIVVGSGLGDFNAWYVGGVDKAPYPYGGWINSVANTSVTPDGTAGTPSGTEQYIGSAVFIVTGPSKGETHNVDVIRYGRGSAIFEFGDVGNGYCTFAGFAAQNDNSSNRWGLIQATAGGYLWKGRMAIGTATNAADFRDTNKNIFIQWTPKVTANFNLIEVVNASTNLEWTGIQIICLDTTTASKGRFLMTNDANVALTGCSFIDMDTFVFSKNANTVTITDSTFRRCGQITTGGATFTGCNFDRPSGATAVLASSPANAALVSNSTFTSAGTGNGLEITGTAGDFTLTNVDFIGYDTADPGTAANKAIYVNIGSGTVNITVSGGSGVTTAAHVRTAGATVNIIAGAVTTTVKVTDVAGGNIQNARVFLKAANGTGPFPYQQSCTIVNSGTTATVTHTGHGLATNDKVLIEGASHWQNNGPFQITVTGTDTYTYTMPSDPGSSPTGTITSTYVAIEGLTDVNGEITMSRVFSSSQPVTGRAAKSTSSPYYKAAPINGTISNTTGLSASAVLISDE